MAGGGGQQRPSHVDHSINLLALSFLVVMSIILIWHFERHWILAPIFSMRYYEIIALEFVANIGSWVAQWLHLPALNIDKLQAAKAYIIDTPSKEVRLDIFASVNQIVGNWLRFPCILLMLGLAFWVKFKHTETRFKNIYNMEKLKKEDTKNWPEIAPILNLDLLKEDLDQGAWAMAMLPMDFCRFHDLLTVGENEGHKIWKIKTNIAHSVLSMQLGPTWTGVHNLPIEIKALVVIFIARALRDRKIANQLLSQIAMSSASGKLNFSGVEGYIQKYAETKPLKWLEQRHAYVYTLLASLLEIARTDGVLASAEFLWLKPVNRRLWYMLNSVGRTTAVVEISGAYAHWLAEKQLGQGIKTPMIKEAVLALETTIEDSLYIEEGDRWHTNLEA